MSLRWPDSVALAAAATSAAQSRFAADVAAHEAAIRGQLAGKRVLALGAAGSIGRSVLRRLGEYGPAAVHVLDRDENGLAELVRDLRSREDVPYELRAAPLDIAGPLLLRWLAEQPAYDVVLDFAALKHVRSEKDACSVLQMLDVNVAALARLLEALAPRSPHARCFAVSTDKGADPASLMGASKRAMEHVLFSGPLAATSTRFANVAFSQGSLLDGWLRRLHARQPLACPRDTRRYLVSDGEAGEICLLAALAARPGHLLVPRPAPTLVPRDLADVLEDVLALFDLRPLPCATEDEARQAMRSRPAGQWPVLFTPRDTSGEKDVEIFASTRESPEEAGFASLLALRADPPLPEALRLVVGEITRLVADPSAPVDLRALVALLSQIVPELHHHDTGRGLDQRL